MGTISQEFVESTVSDGVWIRNTLSDNNDLMFGHVERCHDL